MRSFTAADAVRWTSEAIGRPVDVLIFNIGQPSGAALERYAAEHKAPLELGDLPGYCELVEGEFWCHDIARHDRRRLAFAVLVGPVPSHAVARAGLAIAACTAPLLSLPGRGLG